MKIYFILLLVSLSLCNDICKKIDKFTDAPKAIQEILEEILEEDLFCELEIADSKKDMKEIFKKRGFDVIQCKKKKSTSDIIVYHSRLPKFIIKMNFSQESIKVKKNKKNGVFIMVGIANRVSNANQLAHIIKTNNLKYVQVPKKYYYCTPNDTFVVLAKKINPSGRKISDLNLDELLEIINFIKLSRGILDLKFENMVLTEDKVFFIDTERLPHNHYKKTLKKDFESFKELINPKYVSDLNKMIQS